MSKLPAIQFYPGDWRKDVGVQSLNFHDRGVWFEMLMLMHESEVRGKLMLGGRAMTDEVLASVLRIDLANLNVTVQTLIDRGVTEREKRTGALINRRMLRDEDSRADNRAKLYYWRKSKKVKENGNQDVTNDVTEMKPLSSSSTSVKKRVPAVALPEWLPESLWFDYEDMRKKKRARMTDSIRFRIIKRLEEFKNSGLDPLESLEKSIRCGYTDVFEPKTGGNGNASTESVSDRIRRSRAAHPENRVGGGVTSGDARQGTETEDSATMGAGSGGLF